MPNIRRPLLTAPAVAALLSLAACGSDDGTTSPAPSTDSTVAPAAATTSTPGESPCGVTLAEVHALLPPESGVTENSTPDPAGATSPGTTAVPAASTSPSSWADARPSRSPLATSPSTALAGRAAGFARPPDAGRG
jgi:hypothetical protein